MLFYVVHSISYRFLFYSQIGIDLIGPFCKSEKGNVYLCTMTDYFTKWAEGVPIPDKRAQTVARVLYETFLRQDLKLGNRIAIFI